MIEIQQHHVFFIRRLRQLAQKFAHEKHFTEQHKKDCRNEAKLFCEIENFLVAHLEDKR